MKIVGLTGGIASGKSTVSRWLAAQDGVEVVDLDVLVRRLQTPGSVVVRRIKRAFPGCVSPEGVLDREALGAEVFGDAAKRKTLNALLRWPIQLTLLGCVAKHWRRGTDVLVLDAPLLFETNLDAVCALTVVVSVESKDLQVQRLLERRPGTLDVKAALDRVDSQMPLVEKARRADIVIDNSKSIADLEVHLDDFLLPRLRRRILLWRLNSLPGSLALAAALFVGKTILSIILRSA